MTQHQKKKSNQPLVPNYLSLKSSQAVSFLQECSISGVALPSSLTSLVNNSLNTEKAIKDSIPRPIKRQQTDQLTTSESIGDDLSIVEGLQIVDFNSLLKAKFSISSLIEQQANRQESKLLSNKTRRSTQQVSQFELEMANSILNSSRSKHFKRIKEINESCRKLDFIRSSKEMESYKEKLFHFYDQFEDTLQKLLLKESHQLMKRHFPESYKVCDLYQTLYLTSKMVGNYLNPKEVKLNLMKKKFNKISGCKKVWSYLEFKRDVKKESLLEEYLIDAKTRIETIPEERRKDCSEDELLKCFYTNNYNKANSLTYIPEDTTPKTKCFFL